MTLWWRSAGALVPIGRRPRKTAPAKDAEAACRRLRAGGRKTSGSDSIPCDVVVPKESGPEPGAGSGPKSRRVRRHGGRTVMTLSRGGWFLSAGSRTRLTTLDGANSSTCSQVSTRSCSSRMMAFASNAFAGSCEASLVPVHQTTLFFNATRRRSCRGKPPRPHPHPGACRTPERSIGARFVLGRTIFVGVNKEQRWKFAGAVL